jgi:acyl carrier protein
MTSDEARSVIVAVLARVAPELDPASIDPNAEIGTDLDLDSMDFLNLVEGVAVEVHRDIAERDYPQLTTLASFAEYLADADTTS